MKVHAFKRNQVLLFVVILAGCESSGSSFDKLDPEIATRSLGQCLAYHSAVTRNLSALSDQVQALLEKPNVRTNLQSEGHEWIVRYTMGDEVQKRTALTQAKQSCSTVGLPSE